MAKTPNLELRGRTWWCVRTVPPSLRRSLGKRALRRSLGTSDLVEAMRRRPLALAAFSQQLDNARHRATGRVDLIVEAAEDWRRFAAEAVDEHGQPMPADLAAVLIAEQATEVARTRGQTGAKRFHAVAKRGAGTPIDHYLAEFHRQRELAEKTKFEMKRAVRRLIEWDPALSLESMTKKTASRYVADGLSADYSAATKNKIVTMLSSYFRWLVAKGYIAENPWRGHHFDTGRKGRRGEVERPFTTAEVKCLLAAPFSPRLADVQRIAALSGMRIDEICLLRVADCTDGVFNIRASKSDAGVRVVPIHSQLATMVAARCKDKRSDEFLIHELGPLPPPGAVRPRSDLLSKEFGRYRKKVGVDQVIEGKRRSLVNFHSWRRWFVTEAEQAGQPPWVIEAVVGHKRAGMSLSRYSKGPSIDQLRACVEAVTMPVPA